MEVWPENHAAFTLFCKLQTQWRVGMGGPTGLDYNVLLALLARMKLKAEAHEEMFLDVRVMESAALEAMNEK